MNEAILKTVDLRKEFGGVVAVMDVSFEVEKEEILQEAGLTARRNVGLDLAAGIVEVG